MKGIVRRCYGSPEVVRYEDLAKPTPLDNEILVKVHAASVNPLDWHYLEGKPYMVRIDSGFGKPQNPRLGVDFAGTVEAVGSKVTRFKAGRGVRWKIRVVRRLRRGPRGSRRRAETCQHDIRASRCRAHRSRYRPAGAA